MRERTPVASAIGLFEEWVLESHSLRRADRFQCAVGWDPAPRKGDVTLGTGGSEPSQDVQRAWWLSQNHKAADLSVQLSKKGPFNLEPLASSGWLPLGGGGGGGGGQ